MCRLSRHAIICRLCTGVRRASHVNMAMPSHRREIDMKRLGKIAVAAVAVAASLFAANAAKADTFQEFYVVASGIPVTTAMGSGDSFGFSAPVTPVTFWYDT